MDSRQAIARRLDFALFSAAEQQALKDHSAMIAALIPPALEHFYGRVVATPETAAFFSDPAQLERAKAAQHRHWQAILEQGFTDQYYGRVRRIGEIHARIGLEPIWYVGGYSLVIQHVDQALDRRFRSLRNGLGLFRSPALIRQAFVKAALLDMELSITVYIEMAEAAREAAKRESERRAASLEANAEAVARSASQIEQGASEIATASEDLAQRTERNAAALEQSTSELRQVESLVQASFARATDTLERAGRSQATVGEGRAVARTAVEAMTRVRDSAASIDEVIQGVDKIAFQTRVLAMNAAVEAGRAGDAGRGFAVVADLVSALAMRAEEEAQRARDELTRTQLEIESAVGAVSEMDGALEGIDRDVGELDQLIGLIRADAEKQAQSVTEITSVVAEMDRSTQQNAAMVEQTSAVARSLLTEVQRLAEQTRSEESASLKPVPSKIAA